MFNSAVLASLALCLSQAVALPAPVDSASPPLKRAIVEHEGRQIDCDSIAFLHVMPPSELEIKCRKATVQEPKGPWGAVLHSKREELAKRVSVDYNGMTVDCNGISFADNPCSELENLCRAAGATIPKREAVVKRAFIDHGGVAYDCANLPDLSHLSMQDKMNIFAKCRESGRKRDVEKRVVIEQGGVTYDCDNLPDLSGLSIGMRMAIAMKCEGRARKRDVAAVEKRAPIEHNGIIYECSNLPDLSHLPIQDRMNIFAKCRESGRKRDVEKRVVIEHQGLQIDCDNIQSITLMPPADIVRKCAEAKAQEPSSGQDFPIRLHGNSKRETSKRSVVVGKRAVIEYEGQTIDCESTLFPAIYPPTEPEMLCRQAEEQEKHFGVAEKREIKMPKAKNPSGSIPDCKDIPNMNLKWANTPCRVTKRGNGKRDVIQFEGRTIDCDEIAFLAVMPPSPLELACRAAEHREDRLDELDLDKREAELPQLPEGVEWPTAPIDCNDVGNLAVMPPNPRCRQASPGK